MSGIEEFICYPCGQSWEDKYSFWTGYLSACPQCGTACQAYRDTDESADRKEMQALPRIEGPLFDDPDIEKYGNSEDDSEAEGDQDHGEIAEVVGAAESDTADEDDDSGDDEGADGDDSGDGL